MAIRHQITIDGQSFLAPAGQLLLDAALSNGIELPHDCRAGRCGACMTRVERGITLGGETRQRGMIHACQARVFSDLTLAVEALPPVDRIEARVTAPGRQLLVLSESYDEGWMATVGGHPVPVVRVNGDFLGCVVPAGTHQVALVFAPAHLAWGARVSLGALLVAGLLWGIGRRGAHAPPGNQVTSA